MDRKTMTLFAVAILGMMCLAPMVPEDCSAETVDTRISTVYVYEADFEVVSGAGTADGCLYMVEGSEMHAAMEAYLKDPKTSTPPSGDDRSKLEGSIGETVHVYKLTRWQGNSIDYGGEHAEGTLRLEPYNVAELVKGDVEDVAKVKFNSVKDASGKGVKDDTVYVYTKGASGSYSSVYLGTTFEFVIGEDTSLYVLPDWNGDSLCYYVSFDLEVKKPNGSATAFMAVCFIISAVTIALLALAALKPRWAR